MTGLKQLQQEQPVRGRFDDQDYNDVGQQS